MKRFLLTFILGCASVFLPTFSTNAVVFQSAKDALTNDIFVDGSRAKTQGHGADGNYISIEGNGQNPQADYKYNKTYASKIFKSYSGHITIRQKDIPARLNVKKGSTIQFNLQETPETVWNVEIDENIGKVVVNQVQGNIRMIIIQTNNIGNCVVYLDSVSLKNKQYKVTYSKQMTLIVSK